MRKKFVFFSLFFSLIIFQLISCTKKEGTEKAILPPAGVIPKAQSESTQLNVNLKENLENKDNFGKDKPSIISPTVQKESHNSESLNAINNGSSIRVSGNVVSLKQGNLSFQTKGFIAQQFVNVGDKVSKGQIIAVLDDRSPILQKKLQQQSVQLAKVKFEQAKRDLARTEELIKKNATTPFSLEQAQDTFSSAQIQLTQAETNLNLAEKSLNDTRLIAPYDGKVSGKFKDIGEFVSEGVSVFSAFEDKNVEISLQIHEAQMPRIKVGMEIEVHIPSLNKSAKLKVTKVVDLISKETRMFEVRGKVDSDEINLIPGQFVEAVF